MKKQTKSKVELAGLAAVTALAGAGAYYFLASKSAKKHRTDTVAWMKKAEKEIIAKAKKLKNDAVNSDNYKKIVAEVSKKYNSLKDVETSDVQDFMQTLNGAWKNVEKLLTKKAKSTKKSSKK